jgi:hypothetical protein
MTRAILTTAGLFVFALLLWVGADVLIAATWPTGPRWLPLFVAAAAWGAVCFVIDRRAR